MRIIKENMKSWKAFPWNLKPDYKDCLQIARDLKKLRKREIQEYLDRIMALQERESIWEEFVTWLLDKDVLYEKPSELAREFVSKKNGISERTFDKIRASGFRSREIPGPWGVRKILPSFEVS